MIKVGGWEIKHREDHWVLFLDGMRIMAAFDLRVIVTHIVEHSSKRELIELLMEALNGQQKPKH